MDEALAEALALLASQQDGGVAADAMATCAKVLANLTAHFGEEKFHRVRVANKAFNKKVASVAGGLEVMGAAGFHLTTDEETGEAILAYPMLPEPEPPLRRTLAALQRLGKAYQ